jgi:hypothetical protein
MLPLDPEWSALAHMAVITVAEVAADSWQDPPAPCPSLPGGRQQKETDGIQTWETNKSRPGLETRRWPQKEQRIEMPRKSRRK